MTSAQKSPLVPACGFVCRTCGYFDICNVSVAGVEMLRICQLLLHSRAKFLVFVECM